MRLLVFISFIFLSFDSVYAVRCVQILDSSSASTSLLLPRELRVSEENLTRIMRSSDAPYLLAVSKVFKRLESPLVVDQVVYAFRSHIFNEEPFKRRFFRRGVRQDDFRLQVEGLTGKTDFSESDLVAIWNIESALKHNLDRGAMTQDERLTLAVLLNFSFEKISFQKNAVLTRAEALNEVSSDHLVRAAESIIKTPRATMIFQRLINDDLFKNQILNLAERASLDAEIAPGLLKILRRLSSKSSLKLNRSKKSFTVVLLATAALISKFEAELASSGGQKFYTAYAVQGRDRFLANLESVLFSSIDDKWVASKVLDYIDYFFLDMTLPMTRASMNSLVVDGAKRLLLNAKARASEMKAQETERLMEQERSSHTPLSFKVVDFTPSVDMELNRVNPKKRKNQNRTSQESAETHLEQVEVEDSFQVLPDDLVPIAGRFYTFSFLRGVDLGEQRVVFSQDVIDNLNRHSEVQWSTFLKPLNYGFTSRNGQNGVKKMGVNLNLDNVYEIKPGVSSYRIIMRRDGADWLAIAFLHKDKVDAFLSGL